MKIMVVYDSKAKAYLPPLFTETTNTGERTFADAANMEGHNFNKWAGDFTLFEIGVWDEIDGTITVYEAKQNLGTAMEHQRLETVVPQSGQEPAKRGNGLEQITPEMIKALIQRNDELNHDLDEKKYEESRVQGGE